MTEPALLLHMTEGSTSEGAIQTFIRNNSRPHRIGNPETGEAQQLVPWDRHARSLFNKRGGVETNRRGKLYQYEIVGFVRNVVDNAYPADWWDWLANDIREVCDNLGVPLDFPYDFGSPPETQWKTSPYILSNEEWMNVTGIIGHLHAPENVNGHYDPGPIAPLIDLLQPGRNEVTRMPIRVATGSPRPAATASKGDPEVYEWQTMMQAAGFYTGALDGDFGPKSRVAGRAMKTHLDDAVRRLDAHAKLLEQAGATEAELRAALEAAGEPQTVEVMDPKAEENQVLASRFRMLSEALDPSVPPDLEAFG